MFRIPLQKGWTPEEVALRLSDRPGLAWLDGQEGSGEGRWTFIGCDPVETRQSLFGEQDPLRLFEEPDVQRPPCPQPPASDPLPSAPRWIGYVAYDAAWAGPGSIKRRLQRSDSDVVAWLGRYDALVAFDLETHEAFVLGDGKRACGELLQQIQCGTDKPPSAHVGPMMETSREEHRGAIEAALAHIAAGNIYQVNLARRWCAAFEGNALSLWLAMRRTSPVPLGFFLDTGVDAVLARTMERYLGWERSSGRLWTRPIKGTIARRGADREEADDLRNDPKERAEHAMIVDLMRNDLGRVAETGSVTVERVMEVEPYAGLSHLVSTVACRARPNTSVRDVFEATFPPGSVTGAPKIRAVEIIEALESCPRGIYTGCVGYVDRSGGSSWAVAIRTARIGQGQVTYHAGGGIVSASIPENEVAETELKARVFLDAVNQLEGPV